MAPPEINLINAQNIPSFIIRIAGLNSNVGLLIFAENQTGSPICLSICRGTMFLPRDKDVQRMISAEDYKITVSPHSSSKIKILSFCVEALLVPPTDKHTFVATSDCHSEDLLQLVNYVRNDMPKDVMQQAVWCITDNLTFELYFDKFIRPRIIEALLTLSNVGQEKAIRKSLKYSGQIPSKIRRLIEKNPWCEKPEYKDTIPGRKLRKLKDDREYPEVFNLLGINKWDLRFDLALERAFSHFDKNKKIIRSYNFLVQNLPEIKSWFRQYPPFSKSEEYIQLIRNKERKKAMQVQILLSDAGLSYSYT